jgi:uncharacterized damage-inducible protein DinB
MVAQQTHVKAETFSGMFQFQHGIFENALDNLSDAIALKSLPGTSNHMNWLLGHIVHCRFMLSGMIGLQQSNPFGNMYWSAVAEAPYPTVEEIARQMTEISKSMTDKIGELSDDELMARANEQTPSLNDIISFFAYHEAYHLGQIGLVRKGVGLGTLKSN